jgi:hypothetical protein
MSTNAGQDTFRLDWGVGISAAGDADRGTTEGEGRPCDEYDCRYPCLVLSHAYD